MQIIKLTQDSLQHYFPSANITNSHHVVPGYPYDYVDNNSDTLFVSVGDSWSWGASINGTYIDIFSVEQQQSLRRQHVWGHCVAQKLNADWLNLGQYGQSNRWIADRVNDLRMLQPFLNYKKIIVVCVFTGAGRWFNTSQDQTVDYKKKFKLSMAEIADYDRLLKELNENCVQDILINIKSTTKMQLLMGTNTVEHLGFDCVDKTQLLKTPWYQLLDPTHHSIKQDIVTDLESIKYLQTIESLLATAEQKNCFKKWMLNIIEKTTQRHTIFDNKKLYHDYHPLAHGHKVWADYVLNSLL